MPLLNAYEEELEPSLYTDELALDALLTMLSDGDTGELPSNATLDVELPRAFSAPHVAGARYARREALTYERVVFALGAHLLVPRFYTLAARQIDFDTERCSAESMIELIGQVIAINNAPLLRAIFVSSNWHQKITPRLFREFHTSSFGAAAASVEA